MTMIMTMIEASMIEASMIEATRIASKPPTTVTTMDDAGSSTETATSSSIDLSFASSSVDFDLTRFLKAPTNQPNETTASPTGIAMRGYRSDLSSHSTDETAELTHASSTLSSSSWMPETPRNDIAGSSSFPSSPLTPESVVAEGPEKSHGCLKTDEINISINTIHTINSTTLNIIPGESMTHPIIVSKSRSQELKERRQALEQWNHRQKEVTLRARSSAVHRYNHATTPIVSQEASRPTTTGNPPLGAGVVSLDKSERKRCQRVLERLQKTEVALTVKYYEFGMRSDRWRGLDTRRYNEALQQRSEARLRLAQVEQALSFYQERLVSGTTSVVPQSILKVVSSLTSLQRHTLRDDLEHALALLSDQHGGDLSRILSEIRKTSGFQPRQVLGVGDRIPDFVLPTHKGKSLIDTSEVRRTQRLVILVYWGSWSTLCVATLRAWQDQYATLQSHGVELLAIGLESLKSAQSTATKSGAKFPVLSDPTGSVLSALGVMVSDHPMARLQHDGTSSSSSRFGSLPLASTFLVDKNSNILYRHTSIEPTNRAEPHDVLQALPDDHDPTPTPTTTSRSSGVPVVKLSSSRGGFFRRRGAGGRCSRKS